MLITSDYVKRNHVWKMYGRNKIRARFSWTTTFRDVLPRASPRQLSLASLRRVVPSIEFEMRVRCFAPQGSALPAMYPSAVRGVPRDQDAAGATEGEVVTILTGFRASVEDRVRREAESEAQHVHGAGDQVRREAESEAQHARGAGDRVSREAARRARYNVKRKARRKAAQILKGTPYWIDPRIGMTVLVPAKARRPRVQVGK